MSDRRPGADGARRRPPTALAALALCGLLAACTPQQAQPGSEETRAGPSVRPTPASAIQDSRADAHDVLVRRLRLFLIRRSGPDWDAMATDDERFRLGAFWHARSDTHHFDDRFRARATALLALPKGSAPEQARQAALRELMLVVDTRLPAWQQLVDYNASGRMRDDGGAGGRELLPGAIAAIDAIEVAVWRYIDTVGDRPSSAR